MSAVRLAMLTAAVICCASQQLALGESRELDLYFGTLKDEFLVGEPVDLYVGVSNFSECKVTVPGRAATYDVFSVRVKCLLERPKRRAEFYVTGFPHSVSNAGSIMLGRPSPGAGADVAGFALKQWHVYRIRVVYSFPPFRARQGDPSTTRVGLVYSQAGKYHITALPLFVVVNRDPLFCGFNDRTPRTIIRVKYPMPGTVEDQVWQQIRDPKILGFIQTHGETGPVDVALTVARILREMPVSRYHNGLQAVLASFFRKHRDRLNADQRALIQLALWQKFPPDVIPANRKQFLDFLRQHAPELYRELNVKLAPEKEKRPATK